MDVAEEVADVFGDYGSVTTYMIGELRFADGHRLVAHATLRDGTATVVGCDFEYEDMRGAKVETCIACAPGEIGPVVPLLNAVSVRTRGGRMPTVGTARFQAEIAASGLEAAILAEAALAA